MTLLLAGCTSAPGESTPTVAEGWRTAGSSADATATLRDLPVESLAPDVVSRAAADLAPPTNRWYSGLVFGEAVQRIFPFPLALDVRSDSFAVALPRVVVAERAITSDVPAGIGIGVPADGLEIVRTDPVSVTVRYSRDGEPVGDLTTAQGWPVVAFTAATEVALTADAALEPVADGTWSATIAGQEYGVRAPGAGVDGRALTLAAGATAQWFAVPDDSDIETWAAALGESVEGVSTSFSLGADTASTRLDYGTATILVPFAGRQAAGDCDLGSFDTPYGVVNACAATTLEWTVPLVQPRGAYEFDELDDASRSDLVAQIEQDLALTPAIPADTYFGGKALARLGALTTLASAVGATELADRVADRLELELEPWLDPRGCETRSDHCFIYDDELRLVVSGTPSFGSEEGNDHHFHYGYFLSAAAALAAQRPELVETLAPIMDVLAADVAAGAADDALPALRAFDPYRGHSWASGLSPFADGNNQESSSEAVAAWNGLALWAAASGDDDLAATAVWLLSAEADAARTLWLEPDLPDGYEHGIVSLTWGAKRDYATWFSGEGSAILGIQALPIGPVSLDYLAGDPARVASNVADAGGDAAFDGPLGEYVLQYSALGGPDALAHAESLTADLDPAALDDGTSMSAILAWLAAVRLDSSG
ncbi:MAG: glycosyl hydrolase [Microbacteriaceae bacterium]